MRKDVKNMKKKDVPPVVRKAVKDVIDPYDLTKQQRYLLVKAVVGYVLNVTAFNGQGQNSMYELVRNFLGWKEAQNLRQACSANFDLVVRLRNSIYRLLENDVNKYVKVRKEFEKFGLSRADTCIYFMLNDLGLKSKAQDKLSEVDKDFLLPKEVEKDCENMIFYEKDRNGQTINDFILKYVKRKMSFILNSENIDVEDLAGELRIKAAEVYYQKTPFLPPYHIQNSMKQSIHNAGINLINYYTTDKRKRLVRTDEGFQSRVHSMNQSANEEGTEIGDLLTSDENNDVGENTITLRLSLIFLYNKFSIRKQRALRLLIQDDSVLENIAKQNETNKMVYYNIYRNIEENRFLRWCSRRLGREYTDINDLQQNVGNKKYLRLLKEYLGMSDQKFNKFISDLREHVQN